MFLIVHLFILLVHNLLNRIKIRFKILPSGHQNKAYEAGNININLIDNVILHNACLTCSFLWIQSFIHRKLRRSTRIFISLKILPTSIAIIPQEPWHQWKAINCTYSHKASRHHHQHEQHEILTWNPFLGLVTSCCFLMWVTESKDYL